MADGVVVVAPDSTGKKIDVTELTRADGSTIVERQRMNISDPLLVDAHAGVTIGGNLQVESGSTQFLLSEILIELRTITYYLNAGFNTRQDPKHVRKEMARNV